ncbi:tyrosine-type recombinase/integrase [Marispirochaeta aestuarii]|uniref:tyrosine-type recombinase/integrase n=1 Tax=Marispirochaeta aestuarii TaxID=1963862 RepID=UPI0029C678EF|nr:tyrosine-type recombinase/integrase [Marispirochaeta aestuarii]
MKGKPYSLFRRKNKQKSKRHWIYYAQFKQPDGSFSTAKSTGKTNVYEAIAWAEEYLRSGSAGITKGIRFGAFSDGFFDIDGDYFEEKRLLGDVGSVPSERWLVNQSGYLKNHLLPFFKNYELTDITQSAVKDYQIERRRKGYSKSTIIHSLHALRIILARAQEQGLIQGIPSIAAMKADANERGILTIEEMKKLFNVRWNDPRAYAGNLLAAGTGLRQGEILALQRKSIIQSGPAGHFYLDVVHSWDSMKLDLKPTKTRKCRQVPLPLSVHTVLNDLMDASPFKEPENYIFYSERADRPMLGKDMTAELYRALKKIGIKQEQRKERGIVFHSWRHWYNSLLLNKGISSEKVRSLTGHSTDRMTQNYYHADDYADVLQLQEEIFN